jgi:hypothetical protein
MLKWRMAGGLLLLGLVLTGCAGDPVVMLSAPTAQTTAAATATAQPANRDRFEERVELAGGALRLTATPLRLGPAEFTVEAEGGLVPYEIQGIMASMGHGWDQDLTAAGTKWTAKADWEMDGRWLVRVKAKDAAGQEQIGLFYVTIPA